MENPPKVQGKYYLRSLHQEIDFYDRKLAYTEKYEVFGSESKRQEALGKMTKKRDLLVRSAHRLAAEGIPFEPSELPRSFRSPAPDAETASIE